jgi:PAS domain S-box-containing protein
MPSIYDLPVERRFQLMVEAVIDYAIFLLNPEGVIASWNTGAQRIKGYSAEEIIGQHFSVFYAPEDRKRGLPQESLAAAAAAGKFEAEGWRYRKDGTRFWASVVIDAVRSESGDLLGFAKVTRDITERKQAEEKLLQTREQLLQAQKMDSIGQLTGGIAHDFNNLLTIILSGAQMMERQAGGNETLLRLIGHIRHAVERGERLTRQLLTYSRRQALKPELLNLSVSLQAFAEGILPTVAGNIDVKRDIAEDLWSVEADPNELDLALINIAINARDAMPSGGQMRIRARNEVLTGDEGLSGQYAAISISDTGTGMTAETLAKATEPFFTTKPKGTGTGLGLSQVYGFAKQSGGNLQITSQVGRGTTVTLHLPAAKITLSAARAASSAKGFTVLVVEDELTVAEMARSILSQGGYNVELAHDATEGLAIIRNTRVDAVFSDIVMPGGMNGVELAEKLQRERPDIPILLTTGYYHSSEPRGLAHKVLRKPYDEASLLAAMEKMFDRDPTLASARN